MEKKPRRTWGDGLKVSQGSRDRASPASWSGVLSFMVGVEIGKWLHLGPGGETARGGMSRMPGCLLMMSVAPEYGSFS